jgi:hypothetical protein
MHIQFKKKFNKNIKNYRDMWLEMGQQVFHIEKDMKSWKGTTEQ